MIASLLVISIFCNLEVVSISSLDEETYRIFYELLKGEFYVPMNERTTKINSALVRFWRNRKNLSLQREQICFQGKPVLKKDDVSRTVTRAFKNTKGTFVITWISNVNLLPSVYPCLNKRSIFFMSYSVRFLYICYFIGNVSAFNGGRLIMPA